MAMLCVFDVLRDYAMFTQWSELGTRDNEEATQG
jgi:hypothetical protein